MKTTESVGFGALAFMLLAVAISGALAFVMAVVDTICGKLPKEEE